ncbi:MAG: hypothetical protein LBT77_01210 [Mycoplasmataceae bacterium]|nr:hypothetical protein [Mycoplasmataceae bacterium]
MNNTYKIIRISTTKTRWGLTLAILIFGLVIGWILLFFIPKKVEILNLPYSEKNLSLAHECYPDNEIKVETVLENVYKNTEFTKLLNVK